MRRALAAAAVIAAALTGCAAPAPALPGGITASVFETRFDAALRQLQIRISNDSGSSFQVVAATLESDLYIGEARFERPQRVPAGSARDLPVQLGEAECDPSGDSSTIILEFESATGAPGRASIDLGSPAILAAAHERDCLRAAVEQVATIAPPASLVWAPGSGAPAVLEFTVTPTGAGGSVSIQSVGNTTLVGVVDEAGNRATPLTIGLVIGGASPATVIRVGIEPARCDPHAIAEDKQGTHFPFAVTVADGPAGELRVPVGDDVRAEIYAFVTDYCAR